MRSRKFLFNSLAALLAVLVFLVYYDMVVFYSNDLFRPWYYDIILHFIGGFLAAGFFVYYAYARETDQFPRKPLIAALIIVGFVALVAVFWEFLEFTTNQLLLSPQSTLADTIKDLGMGLLGAVTCLLVVLPKVLKK